MIELAVVGSNQPALIDDCWSHLIGYRWRLDKKGYVMRKASGQRIYLHHVVMPGDRYPAFYRDHINRDKLDNRSCNLRWLTPAQSNQNRDRAHCNRSGYRGVIPVRKRFRATAAVDGVVYRLGTFDTPEEANAVVEVWRSRHMPFAA